MIITIDGPVASGKSSVARLVAQKLHIQHMQSGLLYRAVAYILLHERGVVLERLSAVSADEVSWIADLSYRFEHGTPQVLLGGKLLDAPLQDSSLDQAASLVAASAVVRELLLPVQRAVAAHYDIVADGRDCGSVVFPDADYKFYLTASLAIRAQRMLADSARRATGADVAGAMAAITARDGRDSTRAIAPLIVPDGAVVIDNSDMSLEETIACIIGSIHSS